MKKISSLVKLFTGFAALGVNASDDVEVVNAAEFDFLDEIETAPLNTGELPIYLAAHRSHASHSSHRSSSGGGYKAPAPAPRTAPARTYTPPVYSDPLGQPKRPKETIPSSAENNFKKVMSDKDKRKNIILRVQLTLSALNLYDGNLDGVMGKGTRDAVNLYRMNIGQQVKEKLDMQVLNSLGILIQ
jgi:His-Xaa-Ser repeat protein HxsA